jgi:anti-sigma factor RsiW
MCVEESKLSAYIDGELPEGERKAIEAHLQSCERCTAATARLRRVRERLRAASRSEELDLNAARERVLERIDRRRLASPAGRKGVFLPLPLAVAAAAAFLLMAGALIGLSFGDRSTAPAVSVETGRTAGTERGAAAPGMGEAEIEELIRFLSSQGASVEVRIQLPSSSRFPVRGEPRLIRAGEYEGY